MNTTRDFKETVRARLALDPKFRNELLREGIECVLTGDIATCSPQKQKSWLYGLLYQAILMMQAAKHRRLHNTVTRGQLVSVVAGRNLVLVGFRNSRT
jgi:hypothetical protein